MGFLASRSQLQKRGLLDTIMRMVWAAGLVLVIGSIAHRLSDRPLGPLLGCAIAVLLAALLNGTSSAIAAVVTAAIMGAYLLPPNNSIYIDPPFRVGYGLFIILCILISYYKPPRSNLPLKQTFEVQEANANPYTEANLPTVASSAEELVIQHRRVIEGVDIYQWERSCAHISDLIWDAQIKLKENDMTQAHVLLQHAYEVVAQTRQQIRDVDLIPLTSALAASSPLFSAQEELLEEETVGPNGLTREEYRS